MTWLAFSAIFFSYLGLRPILFFNSFQCGDRLQASDSEVYKRQILTSKVGPRTGAVGGLKQVCRIASLNHNIYF